ncbi:MFS transporter [Nocardioides bruguierae]|uniref:MFS transporter n=1 Tax=Nocardioides bruguierae TaxID=2945102 RepID=A0A9X2IGV9_9ACTN|nr:MFS transporter [Nocardioides bruguierae]MCM0621175.1 MFS transporter [Nocardioides bruguierae]
MSQTSTRPSQAEQETPRRLGAGPAFAMAAVLLVTMIGTTLPTSLYSRYEERIGFGVEMTAVVFAVYALGVIVALLVTGRWSDTLGRKPLMAAALTVGIASDVVFLFASDHLGVLLAGRVVSGLSAGITVGTASVFIVETAAGRLGSRASDLGGGANMLGLGLGPVLAAVLVAFGPWTFQLTYLVHAALCVVGLLVLSTARETVDKPSPRPAGALSPLKPALPAEVRADFVRVSILAFAGFAVFGLYTALIPTVTADVLGISAAVPVSLIILVAYAASLLGHQVVRPLSERNATLVAVALLVAGMACLALSLWQASTVAIVFAGLFGGAGQGVAFNRGLGVLTSRAPGDQKGAVTSTFFVVCYVAISVPVILAGILVAHLGAEVAGLWFALAVAVLAVVAGVLTLAQERRQG